MFLWLPIVVLSFFLSLASLKSFPLQTDLIDPVHESLSTVLITEIIFVSLGIVRQ
jgi:hypothetical protein